MARPRAIPDDKLEEILERITDGDSQADIAKDLGVGVMTLSDYLNRDSVSVRSAQARQDSAEAWLDKGLQAIKDAMRKDSGLDATAARAYAQECARRAAIRNPRYNERLSVDLSAKVTTDAQLTDAELMAIAARKTPGGDVQKG